MSNNYRKPPVEYQFPKGTSGNPKGRPPKKKPEQLALGALGGGIADRFSAMALEEAARPIAVREGDKSSELPAMQALLRTMFRAAAKGDAKVGRQLLELIGRAETARTNAASEMLEFAAQYKERYLPLFEKHEQEGLEPPEIYPHPDDVIIDENTGEVRIDGPRTKEEAGARKAIREQVLKSMRRCFEVEVALAKEPKNRALKREFKELQKYFDLFRAESERTTRHKALAIARRSLEPKPAAEKDDTRTKPNEKKRPTAK